MSNSWKWPLEIRSTAYLLAASLLATPAVATAQQDVEPLFLAGDPAPDLPGLTFKGFGFTRTGTGGDVVFRGDLEGPGVYANSNDSGLFSSRLGLVYRRGDPVPGLPTRVHRYAPGNFVVNYQGEIVYLAYMGTNVTPPSADAAVVTSSGRLVAATGQPVPDGSGETFDLLYRIGIDDTGAVLYGARLSPSDDKSIWREDALVVRQGDPVPGVPGKVFQNVDFGWGATAGDGHIVFGGTFVGGGGGYFTPEGPIAMTGDPAAGTEGKTYGTIRAVVNASGAIAWEAYTRPSGEGIWTEDGPVVLSGQTLPEFPGYTVSSARNVRINDHGELSYELYLRDPDFSTIRAVSVAGEIVLRDDQPIATPEGTFDVDSFAAPHGLSNDGFAALSLRYDGYSRSGIYGVEALPPDTTPPEIALAPSTTCLWPPDHTARPVALTVDATDDSGSLADLWIEVTSDEADNHKGGGDGDTTGDIVIYGSDGGVAGDSSQWGARLATATADLAAPGPVDLDLRAERLGRYDGRTYQIEVFATDAAGNLGSATTQVDVPHDPSATDCSGEH